MSSIPPYTTETKIVVYIDDVLRFRWSAARPQSYPHACGELDRLLRAYGRAQIDVIRATTTDLRIGSEECPVMSIHGPSAEAVRALYLPLLRERVEERREAALTELRERREEWRAIADAIDTALATIETHLRSDTATDTTNNKE